MPLPVSGCVSQVLCDHRSCFGECLKSVWSDVEGEESSLALMVEGKEARCKCSGAFQAQGLGSCQAHQRSQLLHKLQIAGLQWGITLTRNPFHSSCR